MTPSKFSSLSCELRIIQARNTEFKTTGKPVCSIEISAKSNHIWNESVSLEWSGTEMCSMDNILQQESVVFELRWGSTVPRVTVLPTIRHGLEGIKSPQLQVGIKIRVQADNVEMEKKRQKDRRLSRWDECGCESGHCHGCTCPDYEIFALAAALEVF
ncbi:unnamed protein product [Malus baccata var. baccata]